MDVSRLHRKLFRRCKYLTDEESTLIFKFDGVEHVDDSDELGVCETLKTPDGNIAYWEADFEERGGLQHNCDDGFISVVGASVLGDGKEVAVQSNAYHTDQSDDFHTEKFDFPNRLKTVHLIDFDDEPEPEPMTEADYKYLNFMLECTLDRVKKIEEDYTIRR